MSEFNSQSIISDDSWRQRDLAVVWHPCTQMSEHPDLLPLVPIRSGHGAYLEDLEGRSYLDAVSSWWVNLFGHANPVIAAAVASQASSLAHVILAGFTHAPAVELAESLLRIAPRENGREPLAKVFYADNGSAAIEVALKMAFHYFVNTGDSARTKFLSLHNGYHGETLGALAVGDVPLYRKVYAPLLMEPNFVRSPDAFGMDPEEAASLALADLRAVLERDGASVCALILEPLVQCAGGMRIHSPSYLRGARELCDEFGVFLIADEIAVGFGRTGTMFACEQAGVQPDFLCLSKGLTGGTMPLAAVLTSDRVYDAFLDRSRERAFLHSHSYTGNPLACAAALASLSLFESEDVLARNVERAAWMAEEAAVLASHPNVCDVRQTGMIVAFELSPDGTCSSSFADATSVGRHAYKRAMELGVVLRPLGNVLYWMPPYVMNRDDVRMLGEVTRAAIDFAMSMEEA